MSEKNSTVAVYDSHTDLENAVGELCRNGVQEKMISIIGKEDAA